MLFESREADVGATHMRMPVERVGTTLIPTSLPTAMVFELCSYQVDDWMIIWEEFGSYKRYYDVRMLC